MGDETSLLKKLVAICTKNPNLARKAVSDMVGEKIAGSVKAQILGLINFVHGTEIDVENIFERLGSQSPDILENLRSFRGLLRG